MSGIGFRTADEIAVKLGLPRDSIPRLATGLKYVLAQAANEDGHCFLPEHALLRRSSEILQAPHELLTEAVEQLKSERDAPELIGEAMSSGAELILVPVERLAEDFFHLKTGLAGQIM